MSNIWSVLLLFAMTIAHAGSASAGALTCESAFDLIPETSSTRTLQWQAKPLEVIALGPTSSVRADHLPHDISSAFVIAFKGHHAYVSYKGVRVDGFGTPGIRVRAEARESASLKADVLAFVHLTESEKLRMDARFAKIVSPDYREAALTCSRLSCAIVRDGTDKLLPAALYLTPSSLLKKLIALSSQQPERVRIGLPDSTRLEDFVRNMQGDEIMRFVVLPIAPFIDSDR